MPVRPLRTHRDQRLTMSKKQIRERARRLETKIARQRGQAVKKNVRAAKRASKGQIHSQASLARELEALYPRPIEDWDAEELARGRPRSKNGNFMGPAPKWITRQLHEEAMTRFKQMIRDGTNGMTLIAMETIEKILNDRSTDDKGRPVVPASTKLDASKWLVEQAIGKPTQKVEQDISVRLQGLLASTIIVPGELPAAPSSKELTSPRALEQFTDVEVVDDDEDG
jgi:hypothetical protein